MKTNDLNSSYKNLAIFSIMIVWVFYSFILPPNTKKLTHLEITEQREISFLKLLKSQEGVISKKDVIIPSKKIRIAILDTGVDFSHPLLEPFKSPIQNPEGTIDTHGHGTHIAGIIAQRLIEVFGKDASQYVEIVSYKYYGFKNPESVDYLNTFKMELLKLAEISQDEADFVNLSLGGQASDARELKELINLSNKGVQVFSSAGNFSNDASTFYPCAYNLPNSYCIGGLDVEDNKLKSSNTGALVSAWALGNEVSSLPTNLGSAGWMTGTSMATPQFLAYEVVKRLTHNPKALQMVINRGQIKLPTRQYSQVKIEQ